MLGGLLQGVTVKDNEFAGAPFDWLTPFSLFCGAGVVAGYALLGACWLNFKTVGILQDRGRRYAKGALVLVLLFLAGVSVWTPFEFPRIAERWFTPTNLALLWPIPLATAAAAAFAYGRSGGAEHLLLALPRLLSSCLVFWGWEFRSFPMPCRRPSPFMLQPRRRHRRYSA